MLPVEEQIKIISKGAEEIIETGELEVMSIPDQLIIKYFRLVIDVHPDEIDAMERAMAKNEANPRDIKIKLAFVITKLYHGDWEAARAEENFVSVFQRKGIPDDIAEYRLDSGLIREGSVDMVELLVKLGFCSSKSETRRLMVQGAVRINGSRIADMSVAGLNNGDVIQAGKLKFARILI